MPRSSARESTCTWPTTGSRVIYGDGSSTWISEAVSTRPSQPWATAAETSAWLRGPTPGPDPVVEKQGSAVLITGAASVRGQDPAVRADEETQRISTAHRHGRWMQPRADGHNALDGDSDRTPTSVAARSSRRCPGSSTTSRSGRHVGSRYPPTATPVPPPHPTDRYS
jgi:hypothetical protein